MMEMGAMMDQPLLISSIIRYAARHAATQEVVSHLGSGHMHRYTYAQCERRARMLASALERSGLGPGERVGTLAWNSYRHLEIYYAASGMGAVCHTINPRLHIDQIAYIINDANDRRIFFDATFLPLAQALAERCTAVQEWILLEDTTAAADAAQFKARAYEALAQEGDANYSWPVFDENAAAGLCYTSGTTGNPKGVLYSHRSTVLHAYAASLPNAMAISVQEVVAPLVPMFHVNAWGLPYTAPMNGAKLVLPGAQLDGEAIYKLFEAEGVTFSAGVPSVWQGLLAHVHKIGGHFSSFRRVVIGGSACSTSMIADFETFGVTVRHAWGMTEVSPLGTVCMPMPKHRALPQALQVAVAARQGRALFGIDMRIADDQGKELPWDGKTFGNLEVRGNWVLDSYFGSDKSALNHGWFGTGDVATIDADGYLLITDRSKDVIKSGGEWISSIEIENIAMAHPSVFLAACVATAHPKWDERPILVVVKKTGEQIDAAELLQFFQGKVAKWWLPDAVVFIDEMPLTATGKMQKRVLRERYRNYLQSGAAPDVHAK